MQRAISHVRTLLSALPLVIATASHVSAADVKLTPDELDFFEKKIRPVFVDNCYKCHSRDAQKVKASLFLDTRDGVLKGGETGPAIVPGHPEKSLLISAVHYTNKDLQMPPNDKQLPANVVADLETWVKMGAPDPRTGKDDGPHKINLALARQHWSFQPITNPPVPQPADPSHWAQSPVDQFILAALVTNKLSPGPAADKSTLLRRATFDLIGTPPTPKEMDDFLADTSTNTFATVVDRLLASPHYGERWGRYWLDLAHFADTRGLGNRDDIYPYAYTYRDYVIRSFNQDLPYDQFIIQQIAADKLPQTDDKSAQAALGFLTLGNRFNNQVNDIIDDRIDIISKGTMALTMACARCHDHKFDPIPTEDYYSLHGVFSSCTEPKEGPLIEPLKDTPAYNSFHREYTAHETALKEFREENFKRFSTELVNKSGAYLIALREYRQKSNEISRNAFLEKKGLNGQVGAQWENSLRNWERRHNPIMAPWIAFAQLDDAEFAAKAPELAAKFHDNAEKDKPINTLISAKFDTAPESISQVAARYVSVFTDVQQHWRDTLSEYDTAKKLSTNAVPPPEPKKLPDAAEEQVRQFIYNNGSPMFLDDNRLNNFFIGRDNNLRNKQNDLEKALSDLLVNHPGSPARAPALTDMDKPRDSVVFIKGNPGNRGAVVPRHFLSILSADTPATFKDGSGRLELARDIASKDNPLTARVIVNRVWLHHFGEGIVRTPDDFGERGATPSHPELLDYLATRFMDDGWSIKKLHRLIMLSSVYQQSSDESALAAQTDPENRWLSHMNRRRLDFESVRDTVLAIGGDLDPTVGGKSVHLDTEPYSLRRAVYGFVDRRNVPNVNQAFDFAPPDLTTGRRQTTLVPQQALFMMNNPLVVEQSRNLVRRMNLKSGAKTEDGVVALYRLVYQRPPSDVELKLALDYVRTDSLTEWQTNAQSAWEYGYGNFDPLNKRTRSFVRMGTFAGNNWQPGGKPPDPALKGLQLTADGGHPARAHAAIRRWSSPREGYISIEGTLGHPAPNGDGVLGRIVSSRLGELGNWTVTTNREPITLSHVFVGRGDTIDFVVECRDTPDNDAFKWPIAVKMEPPPYAAGHGITEWDSQKNFSGSMQARRMNAWEKLVQVLLETNELTFVN